MTDNTPLLARPCNNEMVEFVNRASELRLIGRPVLYEEYQPVPHPPMWLTDRHLASDHSLQRVVFASDLLQNMEREGNTELVRFLSENAEFPGLKDLPHLSMKIRDRIEGPSAFMFRYAMQVGRICAAFATSMYILPNQRNSGQAFSLLQYQRYPMFLNQAELKLFQDYRDLPFPDFGLKEEAIKKVSHGIIEKLRVIRENHNCLATFNYLPPYPESDQILTDAVNYGPHSWITPATISPKNLDSFDQHIPLDSPNTWWSEYATHEAASNTSERVQHNTNRNQKTVWIPPHKGKRHAYEPEAREFIQRAWCRAVETDATFMVISSGNKERIGIRHRETQTLFLSDLIDPFEVPYVRIHMFLHAAILKEAMERVTPQPLPVGPQTARKRKRHSDLEGKRVSKRLRGEPSSGHGSGNIDMQREISCRNILLVSFNFGVYHSSAPSSFIRISPSCHPDFVSALNHPVKTNKKYPIAQCMNFVATEKVGSGRTGAAFRGVVQIQTGDGSMIEEGVILKIPLGAQPVSRIHDEYKFYTEFAKAGITEGILMVYGVFEDVESGSVAMMMRDGGTDLWQRERERKGSSSRSGRAPQISLSQDEFDVLHRVITRINMLNILHFDIKPDNILSDEKGRVSLIDFDSAWRKTWREGDPESADILTLRDLLAGTFVKDGNYPRF